MVTNRGYDFIDRCVLVISDENVVQIHVLVDHVVVPAKSVVLS